MLRALLRLLLALGGAALAALLVTVLEARSVAAGAADTGAQLLPPIGSLVINELGLLSPVALGIGGAMGVLALLLEPQSADRPFQMLSELRGAAVIERLRVATVV